MNAIREPAVAGYFYPAAADELAATVSALLDAAQDYDAPTADTPPKALIVPHAGYIYSGPTAAAAYARLLPWREFYRHVILMGPCHRVPVRGLAASAADAFRTPLGDVPLDSNAITARRLSLSDAAHRNEHSLEVQLPFLQELLDAFDLVPIVVGDAPQSAVADVLEQLWDGPETLFVISSDLSHYLGYAEAQARDRATRDAIERFDATAISHGHACGATPVGGLLIAAQRHGLKVSTIDLCNSGDTAGDRKRVVGYGAWLFA